MHDLDFFRKSVHSLDLRFLVYEMDTVTPALFGQAEDLTATGLPGLEPHVGTTCAICLFPPGSKASPEPQLSCPVGFAVSSKGLAARTRTWAHAHGRTHTHNLPPPAGIRAT